MVQFRPFHNADPPRIVELWHAAGLGPGAAEGFSCDALELLNFSQPYFDPDGLILAFDEDRLVGCVHAGFGVNAEETALDYSTGVICAVLVHPLHRRRGLGTQLVERARAYLRERGAETVYAGGATGFNPFFVGVYGGSQPSGFLETDPNAAPFFESLAFAPNTRHCVYRRDLQTTRDPVHFRLVQNRRRYELQILGQPRQPSWWWLTRFGRLDSLQFQLVAKGDRTPLAEFTVIGLDLYLRKWQQRAVGLTDLFVTESNRGQGLAQTLLVETCRKLREELVTLVEIHAPHDNAPARAAIESASFTLVDHGVVYSAPNESDGMQRPATPDNESDV